MSIFSALFPSPLSSSSTFADENVTTSPSPPGLSGKKNALLPFACSQGAEKWQFSVLVELTGQQEGASQMAQGGRLQKATEEAPACLHGLTCCNQSDWIRVTATLIMSEVTQALWQDPRGTWLSLLRLPCFTELTPSRPAEKGPALEVCEPAREDEARAWLKPLLPGCSAYTTCRAWTGALAAGRLSP